MSFVLFSRMSSSPLIRTAFSSASTNSRCFSSLLTQQHLSSTNHHQTTINQHRLPPTSCAATNTPFTTTHRHKHREHRAREYISENTILATGPDGTQYQIPIDYPLGKYRGKRNAPKLAPSIASSRINNLRTTEGKLKNIRHSPWRLNLVCQFAAAQPTVHETLMQLAFTEKVKAPTVAKLIAGVADNARVKYGLVPSQMEVAECFSTHGTPLKRVKFMGRGRMGRKKRRFSHIRVVLREIDFPLKIITAKTKRERAKWVNRMQIAEKDYEEIRADGEELEKLEREVKEMEMAKQQEEETKNKK